MGVVDETEIEHDMLASKGNENIWFHLQSHQEAFQEEVDRGETESERESEVDDSKLSAEHGTSSE